MRREMYIIVHQTACQRQWQGHLSVVAAEFLRMRNDAVFVVHQNTLSHTFIQQPAIMSSDGKIFCRVEQEKCVCVMFSHLNLPSYQRQLQFALFDCVNYADVCTIITFHIYTHTHAPHCLFAIVFDDARICDFC